jgi:hypothetical protein
MKISFRSMKPARIGFSFVLVATTAAAIPADASARHHKHITHHHVSAGHVRNAQASAAETPATTLGPMRYYGGPKSPMWRQ